MLKIKAIREKLNLSQDELAKKIGVSQSSVAKWENCDNNPRCNLLPKIASILGCSVDELLQDEKEVVS